MKLNGFNLRFGALTLKLNSCCLFDDLDGAVGTLNLASSTDETFAEIDHLGLSIYYLKNAYGADVLTRSTCVALVVVNLDFDHAIFTRYTLKSLMK